MGFVFKQSVLPAPTCRCVLTHATVLPKYFGKGALFSKVNGMPLVQSTLEG